MCGCKGIAASLVSVKLYKLVFAPAFSGTEPGGDRVASKG